MAQRGNLTAAKETRKRSELDLQLLMNRVALLKSENEKAQKRITETKQRATDIMSLRVANEKKAVAKEKYYRDKWNSVKSAQAQNAFRRDKQKAQMELVSNCMKAAKASQVQALKQKSADHLMHKKEREHQEQEANRLRAAMIKKQKDEGLKVRDHSRQEKLRDANLDYEARVATEEMLRVKTEALVAQMEKEEMELISKLQLTQTQQRQAYEELESALGATSQPAAATAGKNSARGGGPQRTPR